MISHSICSCAVCVAIALWTATDALGQANEIFDRIASHEFNPLAVG